MPLLLPPLVFTRVIVEDPLSFTVLPLSDSNVVLSFHNTLRPSTFVTMPKLIWTSYSNSIRLYVANLLSELSRPVASTTTLTSDHPTPNVLSESSASIAPTQATVDACPTSATLSRSTATATTPTLTPSCLNSTMLSEFSSQGSNSSAYIRLHQ